MANLKSSLNCYWTDKKNILNDSIDKFKKYNFNDDNIRYKIIKEKNNIINQKLSLPNLNVEKKEKKILSSNKNQNKLYIKEMPKTEHDKRKKYNYYSTSHHNKLKENNKEKIDNFQIAFLSTFSHSSNIIIPIISNQKRSRNTINYEKNQIFEDIKKFNTFTKGLEENKINNINGFFKNKVNESVKRNYLPQKKGKGKHSLKKINLLLNIENSFMPKLHKIKVQKGIMGNKLFEKLKNNLLTNEYIYYSNTESNSNHKLPFIN